MKYLTNKKLWSAIIGLVTAFGTLMVTLDEAKANTSIPQGWEATEHLSSKVDNGTCHAYLGYGKYTLGGTYWTGGWNDNSYSNVEIWLVGTTPSGCSSPPDIPGFTTTYKLRTGAYTAGRLEGAMLTFFNYMNFACSYHKIVFDTNINNVLDTTGMSSAEWRATTGSAYEYQSNCKAYSSTLHTKLAGANDLYGAYTKTAIDGRYQIGVGSEVLTNSSRELYFFYQYWEGGVLKRKYLKQTNYSHYALVDSATATPIYSKTKLEAGKILLAGTVAKVAGRVYYIKVDSTLNGSPDSGYDVEIPALP